jgi:hypothetical protein
MSSADINAGSGSGSVTVVVRLEPWMVINFHEYKKFAVNHNDEPRFQGEISRCKAPATLYHLQH